eukprot:COSAG04_NODE_23336_length_340_cov_0.846473_2_plen_54_part_01
MPSEAVGRADRSLAALPTAPNAKRHDTLLLIMTSDSAGFAQSDYMNVAQQDKSG